MESTRGRRGGWKIGQIRHVVGLESTTTTRTKLFQFFFVIIHECFLVPSPLTKLTFITSGESLSILYTNISHHSSQCLVPLWTKQTNYKKMVTLWEVLGKSIPFPPKLVLMSKYLHKFFSGQVNIDFARH